MKPEEAKAKKIAARIRDTKAITAAAQKAVRRAVAQSGPKAKPGYEVVKRTRKAG